MPSSHSLSPLPHAHRRRGFAVVGLVVGASAIAAWTACLPIMTVPSLASANAAPQSSPIAATTTTSNAALKGDRLSIRQSKIGHGGGGAASVAIGAGTGRDAGSEPSRPAARGRLPTEPSQAGSTSRLGRRLPVGCEGAFGGLARAGDVPARCVTSLERPARAA